MRFIYSMILSIKDLANPEIKKLSIINGGVWFIIWLIIAFLSWKFMYNLSYFLLSLFPFSFIQISGAQIIYTFLWLQSILITIGIIFAIFNEPIEKSLEKTHFHYLAISSGIAIISFWSYIFLSNKEFLENYLLHILKILPFQTIQEVLSFFLTILFFYLLYCISISISFVLFSEDILIKLTETEYPQIEINTLDKKEILKLAIKDLIIFIIIMFLIFPLFFIPWINMLTFILLWGIGIKNSYYLTLKKLFNIQLTKKEIYLLSFFSTFLNFLPIINIFSPAFSLLMFYHYSLEKKLDNQN